MTTLEEKERDFLYMLVEKQEKLIDRQERFIRKLLKEGDNK